MYWIILSNKIISESRYTFAFAGMQAVDHRIRPEFVLMVIESVITMLDATPARTLFFNLTA